MTERNKCPRCGGFNITKEDDKSETIGYAGHVPIYGKRFICHDCRNEWK